MLVYAKQLEIIRRYTEVAWKIHCENKEHRADYKRDASRKTVDTVGEVCAVDDIDYRQKHYYVIKNAKLKLAPRGTDRSIGIEEISVREQIQCGCESLQNKLLRAA